MQCLCVGRWSSHRQVLHSAGSYWLSSSESVGMHHMWYQLARGLMMFFFLALTLHLIFSMWFTHDRTCRWLSPARLGLEQCSKGVPDQLIFSWLTNFLIECTHLYLGWICTKVVCFKIWSSLFLSLGESLCSKCIEKYIVCGP